MTLKDKPFITTVMPCFNGDRYLTQALEAFFSQDYPNKKLVIVDGKSTDESHQIIADFIAKGYPLIWDKTEDTGISNAINIGLKHLNTDDIFAYLGADDILMPNILSKVSNLFFIARGIEGLYFDSYGYIDISGKLTYRCCPTGDFTLKNLLKFGTIVGLQNIYIKGSLIKEQRFTESNKFSMDYDLYLRLAMSGTLKFCYVPIPSTVNMMNDNISTQFIIEGAMESIHAAVFQVGYTPRLMYRQARLCLARIKKFIISK